MYTKYPIGLGWFIVLRNDEPMMDAHGSTLIFYRPIDADRFIDRQKEHEERYALAMKMNKTVYLDELAGPGITRTPEPRHERRGFFRGDR